MYFAGDDLFDSMVELAGADVALVPIGGWGRRSGQVISMPLGGRRDAAARRAVVPIHWGTYSPITARAGRRAGSPSGRCVRRRFATAGLDERLHLLEPGGRLLPFPTPDAPG